MKDKELKLINTLNFPGGVVENVKFPTVKQIIDIETMRVGMTRGAYGQLVIQHTLSSSLVLDYIDAISTFIIMCPNLQKQMKIADFMEAELISVKQIVNVYREQYVPWYKTLIAFLNDEPGEETKDETANQSTEV